MTATKTDLPLLPKISTKEMSALFCVEAQTIRRAYCVDGHYLGLKPLKLPNRRLLWPKAEVLRVLEVSR